MAPVTMPPVEEARDIFRRLGYAVSGEGTELRAERKWRTVRVSAMDGDAAASAKRVLTDGGRGDDSPLRCFVTWKEYTGALYERLRGASPSYEWAIIGVDDGGEYEVVMPDDGVAA
ncbi:DUF7116 family protein [Halegenticoccus tardaugens]|uniref:DUF7116 family protein n=1 Tax=Halegenticoccus tardaugens TaxID=2071624 RepID=UPI00100C289D|nr:hypothetical protein [Halegenticoccus tardaugens]